MAFKKTTNIAITTAAVAGTEIASTVVQGLAKFDWITIYAQLLGPTGGTLDVYLQTEVAANVWADWAHFPQLAATIAGEYALVPESTTVITTTGIGTTAAPGVALAANTCIGGHPGDKLRAVVVSGVGTSAGAAQVIYIVGWCAK